MGEEASSTDAREARIAFLAEQIAYHSNLYYNLAQPELSDGEFDRLWDELKQLDPEHPQLSRVGADIAPGSVKVDHLFPMRSLDKATTSEELNHFVNVTTSGALQFLSQPKLDGSALSLEYRMGRRGCHAERPKDRQRAPHAPGSRRRSCARRGRDAADCV
ncbi:MAG: DNA ligase LigA-related protein [Poseidonia sp.]